MAPKRPIRPKSARRSGRKFKARRARSGGRDRGEERYRGNALDAIIGKIKSLKAITPAELNALKPDEKKELRTLLYGISQTLRDEWFLHSNMINSMKRVGVSEEEKKGATKKLEKIRTDSDYISDILSHLQQ